MSFGRPGLQRTPSGRFDACNGTFSRLQRCPKSLQMPCRPASVSVRRNLNVGFGLEVSTRRRIIGKAAVLARPATTERRGITFPIPVDYTQLLGLRGRESYFDSQISSAFEDQLSATLEEGYSSRALEGRNFLLQEALEELQQTKGRGALDSPGICVEWGLLPGALALLQQVGEADIVLETGQKALDMKEAKPFRRDLLLSMALAQCTLAAQAFDTKDEVRVGCARLEEALALLKDAGTPPLARTLESEIGAALRELRPACVLEQLKLSLSASNAPTRAQAIAVLKTLLANPASAMSKDGKPLVDATFVRCAIQQLTSKEVLQLVDWVDLAAETPESIPWYYPGLLETVGLAHIVCGFLEKRPSLVKVGENILHERRQTADSVVERAVAKVLLGEPDAAIELLQEVASNPGSADEGESTSRAGPANELPDSRHALPFIQANTPAGDSDYLHGLCLYTELWLSKVAFPLFRDTSEDGPLPSLTLYFEDKRVTSYLSLHSREAPAWKANLVGMADSVVRSVSQKLRPLPKVSTSSDAPPEDADTGMPILASLSMPALHRHLTQSNSTAFGNLMQGFAVLAGAASLCAVSLLAYRRGALSCVPALNMHRVQSVAAAQLSRLPRFPNENASPAGWTVEGGVSFQEAESLIRQWQAVKSEAMGPRHVTRNIPAIAAGPLVKELIQDAHLGESKGWFWTYRLKSIKVEHIDCSRMTTSSKSATITARIHEAADLFAANGQQAQEYSFDNPYTVEYTMTRQVDGSLKLTGVLVIG